MTTTPPTEGNDEAIKTWPQPCPSCGSLDHWRVDGMCRPAPAVQASDEAVEKAVRTADGQVLTLPEVAALDAIKARIGWASLHWRTDEVSSDAWTHLAIAAARAALSAATPVADEKCPHGSTLAELCAGWEALDRPSPGVVDLRPGLREAVEALRDNLMQHAHGTEAETLAVREVATDLTTALAQTRPGGDDARVVAAEAEAAAAGQERDELREKVAYLRDGVLNLDRDEIVQRITAVGSAEWRAGHWLGEHDQAIRDEARVALAALRERIEGLAAEVESMRGDPFTIGKIGALIRTRLLADTAGAPRTDVSAECGDFPVPCNHDPAHVRPDSTAGGAR